VQHAVGWAVRALNNMVPDGEAEARFARVSAVSAAKGVVQRMGMAVGGIGAGKCSSCC